MTPRNHLFAAHLVIVAACDAAPVGSDWVLQEHIDVGTVCFGDTEIDQPVAVSVDVQECLSSSCSRDLQASCTAEIVGGVIVVQSEITWEQDLGVGIACTEDCGLPSASCELAGLPEGTYDVQLGGQQGTLVVPSPADCAGP